jgi:hypothetical protein
VRGGIQGVSQIGGDVGEASKGAMVGVLRGTKQVGTEAMNTIAGSASTAVKSVSEVGGNVGSAAKSAVEGVISGVKQGRGGRAVQADDEKLTWRRREHSAMEWYGAFALLVTLVWLYLEILRLLSKLQSRQR